MWFTRTYYDITNFMKGGWENDETVEEAAVREAVEEAGVRGELLVIMNLFVISNMKFSLNIYFIMQFIIVIDKGMKDHDTPGGVADFVVCLAANA